MLQIAPLKKEDITQIIQWNEGTDAEFLKQWCGPAFQFPLTEQQIEERVDTQGTDHRLFKIFLKEVMIGTIELLHIQEDTKSAFAGRFLLDPRQKGKGYGTEAFHRLLDFAFEELQLETVGLHVYAYNKNAIACYKKVGFKTVEEVVRPDGNLSYQMEIKKAERRT